MRAALIRFMLIGIVAGSGALVAQSTDTREQRSSSKGDPAYLAARQEALRRARVWFEPPKPIAEANLGLNDSAKDGFREDAVVTCKFKVEGIAGSTPKFVCETKDGDDFKVKYGRENAEVYTEVLSTRLLGALGFPADRMYRVAKVRCFGCSADPFKDLQCMNDGTPKEQCFPAVDYSLYQDFDNAVIERTVDGARFDTTRARGWSWKELATIDAAAGGSSPAEVDALRLLAVFLGHWDNKDKNQRLLCFGESEEDDAIGKAPKDCDRPVAMVQDVGATFGPDKLNLEKWRATPVWTNASQCLVSMRALPYGGSTFADTKISEDGRVFLANLLRQLSTEQIRGLFEGAKVAEYAHATAAGRKVDNWVQAFEKKVDAIVNRPPCPTVAAAR